MPKKRRTQVSNRLTANGYVSYYFDKNGKSVRKCVLGLEVEPYSPRALFSHKRA